MWAKYSGRKNNGHHRAAIRMTVRAMRACVCGWCRARFHSIIVVNMMSEICMFYITCVGVICEIGELQCCPLFFTQSQHRACDACVRVRVGWCHEYSLHG
jgi:hypothetical protein